MRKIFMMCAVFLVSRVCTADTVFLNDGQVLRGDIVSENADSIVIQAYRGNEETIGRNFVKGTVREENYDSYRRLMRKGYARGGQWYNDEWVFKLGVDLDGTHDVSNGNLSVAGSANKSINGSQHVNSSMSVGGEYVSYIDKNLGLGGGMDIQSFRSLSDGSGSFSFMPIYGLIKVRTNPGRNNSFEYLTGQIGYNFFDGDINYVGRDGSLDGGLYWGLGAGVSINRIRIELLYTENRGKAEDSGYLYDAAANKYNYFSESGDIKYSKFGLNIGFIF